MWVHARRWRVGNPAVSAGGRLGAIVGVPVSDPIPSSVRPLLFLSTNTFRVAVVLILSTQTFGVL